VWVLPFRCNDRVLNGRLSRETGMPRTKMRVALGWYASKMVEPTIESALRYVDQSTMLTEADRAHLKRWFAQVKNPLWNRIAEEIGGAWRTA
jgi:hypothetical protein